MGASRHPGGGRPGPPLRRYRAWLARSITNRVSVTALGLAMAVAMVLGLVSFAAVRWLVRQQIDAELRNRAHLLEQDLASSLNAMARDVGDLAANSFVTNGLVDSEGRDTYLLPFLREHRGPSAGAELILCDYQGRPIASNLAERPGQAPAAAGILAAPRPSAAVERVGDLVRLVLAYPVVFPPTGQREGVLVARLDLGAVFAAAASARDPDIESTLLVNGAEVLGRARPTAGSTESTVVREVKLAPPLDALSMRLVLGHGEAAFAPLRWIGLAYVLIGLLTLATVSGAARRSARGMTARITRLSDAAREIAAGADHALPAGPEPHDEVDTVASAFNGTLARLRAVQDSLEQKVQERTADLVQRERELQHSREQLALAVEGSLLGVWTWELATGRLTFNDLWPSLLGYRPDEVGNGIAEWARRTHPEDVRRARRDVLAHLRGRDHRLDLELRVQAKDGGWRWIHTRGKVVERGAGGRPIRMAGTHTDITARRQAEAELRTSRAELRALAARLDSVREEEQARIATDLHDQMGQLLTALKMNVRWIERKVEELPPEPPLLALLDRAVDATELVDQAIAAVQGIAAELRPGVLDWLGLESALQQEARRFQKRAGIPCELTVEAGLPAPSSAVATALYRIAVEALTNVARHAGASRVTLSLGLADGLMRLRVADDGAGIPPGVGERPALGIAGMRERAERQGGAVVIAPGEAGGTVVTASLPLTARPPDEAPAPPDQALDPAVEGLVRPILVVGGDGTVEHLDGRVGAFTGCSVGELVRDPRRAFHPDDAERVARAWRQAVATGAAVADTFRVRRHDGAYRWFYAAVAPERDAQGQVTRWVATATDVHAARSLTEPPPLPAPTGEPVGSGGAG